MKQQIRILGIDDSPFKFGGGKALVVGALVRIPNYLEGVMKSEVTVDGTDSTETIIRMVSGSRFRDQIKLIMIDGIALAGFNVIDLKRVYSSLDIPVLTVTRDKPDFDKMKAALMKYFEDWNERYSLITKFMLKEIHTEYKPLYACGIGMDWAEFEELVRKSTVRGVVPEPIRMAHLIASAIVRGESYGRS
jgi:endonuclease V-like protein UPF0215 family